MPVSAATVGASFWLQSMALQAGGAGVFGAAFSRGLQNRIGAR